MNAPAPAVVPPRRARLSFDLPAWGLATATVAGFAGRWNWILDLASHFRWYYLLAALVWYAITSRRRSLLATGCLLLTVLVNTWAMLPYWLPAAAGSGVGDTLDILSLNLDVQNHDRERVLGYLRARSPDVIVLLEVDDAWASAIRELDPLYPHRVIETYKGNFGLAVLSRLPLDAPRVEILAGGTPIIVTGLPAGARGCLLVAAHPPAPIAAAWSERRDAQLVAMGQLAAAESRPVIVAGDLNATPWCHGFRGLVEPAGLRDSSTGRGVQGSWHARSWAPRIPIDHVLVSPNVTVTARSLGPHVGSDHLPVEATLLVP